MEHISMTDLSAWSTIKFDELHNIWTVKEEYEDMVSGSCVEFDEINNILTVKEADAEYEYTERLENEYPELFSNGEVAIFDEFTGLWTIKEI